MIFKLQDKLVEKSICRLKHILTLEATSVIVISEAIIIRRA